MNDKKFIVGVGAIVIVLVGGGYWIASQSSTTPSVQSSAGAKVQVKRTQHDWGEIGINNGKVTAMFPITNSGQSTLKLFNAKTSCMCTTAQLSLGGEKSPLFGMHAKSGYVLDVPPGKTANLEVVFDPAFHGPQGVGAITREIVVETNDPQNPELTFVASAIVTK